MCLVISGIPVGGTRLNSYQIKVKFHNRTLPNLSDSPSLCYFYFRAFLCKFLNRNRTRRSFSNNTRSTSDTGIITAWLIEQLNVFEWTAVMLPLTQHASMHCYAIGVTVTCLFYWYFRSLLVTINFIGGHMNTQQCYRNWSNLAVSFIILSKSLKSFLLFRYSTHQNWSLPA